MIDPTDLTQATAAVYDPTTSPTDLAKIAYVQPSLRTAVAAHPQVYPGLLEWLAQVGTPVEPQSPAVVAPAPQAEISPAPETVPTPEVSATPEAAWVPTREESTDTAAGLESAAPPEYLPTRAQPQPVAAEYAPVATPTPLPQPTQPLEPTPILQSTSLLDDPQPTAVPNLMAASKKSTSTAGIGLIVAGVAVFIICSIIQGAGGSSMFASTYYPPDSVVLDALMNITFYPGWIGTAALIIAGISSLVKSSKTS